MTQRALKAFVKLFPSSEWSMVKDAILENREVDGDDYYSRIFSIGEILHMAYAEYENNDEYIIKEPYRSLLFNSNMLRNMELSYPGFNKMIENINENSNKCIEYASNPSIVYINGKSVYINYDYDLIEEFVSHTLSPSSEVCYDEKKRIGQELLLLAS